MNELVVINSKQLEAKEHNGERVITAWDIAEVHGREVKKINQQFERNKDKLVEGEDYFILNREEFFESHKVTQKFIPNNVKEIPLFTESGYLMLVKTFSDDLSWAIQKQLIKSYFRNRVLRIPATMEEALEITLSLENKNQVLQAKIEQNKPKLAYLNSVLQSKGTLLATEIAADYDMSAMALNTILNKARLIRKVGSQWVLYKKHMGEDYMDSETIPYIDKDTGEDRIKIQNKWTQKGREKIHEILTGLGISAVMDGEV